MKKLKNILENIALQQEVEVDKYSVIENVSQYGNIGTKLYNENNILELAEQLVGIAESAHAHVLSETDDWFDKVSVNRNMKQLQGMVKEFKKTATESHMVNQRLTALYEDMGGILNRYYDINEGEGLLNTEEEDFNHEEGNPAEEKYLKQKKARNNKHMTDRATSRSAKMVPHHSPDYMMTRKESVDKKDSKLINLLPTDISKK
jgi:hypothetical protein